MTRKSCAALHKLLDDPGAIFRVDDASAFVDSFACRRGLHRGGPRRLGGCRRMGQVRAVHLAATRHPDSRYVPILCSVLQQRDLNVNFEDIVTALDEIADPQ